MPRQLIIMKFVILIAIVFALAAGAQEIHGMPTPSQELDRLTTTLHLTDAQRSEVQPLLNAHQHRIQVLLNQNPTLSRTDLEPQIHAIGDETHHEIDAVLTPAQLRIAKRFERHSVH